MPASVARRIARAIADVSRDTGWRLCPRCRELSIPPDPWNRRRTCVACVVFVPAPPGPAPKGQS
jgi:hypothetical protein